MNKLVVIEFSDGMDIHILNVVSPVNDEFVKNLGFDLKHCEWFVGQYVNIHK